VSGQYPERRKAGQYSSLAAHKIRTRHHLKAANALSVQIPNKPLAIADEVRPAV
jgi:hypothetical protein